MIVYRICKAQYGTTAFSGAGGLDASGRWHHQGQPIVYAAATLSLAALEYFIHLGRTDARISLVAVTADIPDRIFIPTVNPASLPRNWDSSPPIEATKDLGSRWCSAARSALIQVPSAVVPGEYNYLLNPRHPDFQLAKISTLAPFSFDARMWK